MDSKKVRQKATPSLPTEVVTEILSWLPLKPLARAQLVSTEFGALIHDHCFTEKHTKRAPYVDHWYNTRISREDIAASEWGYRYLHGCDGLLLLKDNRSPYLHVLWNPATRLLLELPPPHDDSYGLSLCFVPATGSYKIVSFFRLGCQVLTPGPSMEWRGLEFPKLVNGNSSEQTLTLVPAGGDVHCVVLTKLGVEIVSLDVETELLILNQLPTGVFSDVGALKAIECDGKLGLGVIAGHELQMMVLQDFRKKRWCRNKEVIPLPFLKDEGFQGRNVVVLLIKEGGIWFWLEDEKIFVYTIETGKISDVKKTKGLTFSDKLYSYKPSLVAIEGMREERHDDKFTDLRPFRLRLD